MRNEPTEALTRTAGPGTPAAWSGDSAERFLPGTVVVGRYRIRGRIGVGGMGEVYHADDLRLGQAVALKFLNLASEGDPARLQALVEEVRVARQVAHPNVCRVYDIGEVDGLPFLTMEFIDGEDLASLLRRVGRLPAPKLVELGHQLCAGLAAAHQIGIVHRDLKPANIMVDGRGIARVADFGIAVPAGTPSDGEVSGTPGYMAPEQRLAEAPTPASDLYALGLILYEAATGDRYVEKPDGTVLVSGLPEGLSRGIAWCLQKDPARRPGSALEVAALLPGGNLLAATLQAGGTPSPELVAVSGESRGLSGPASGALFAISVATFAAVIWLAGIAVIANRVPLPKPPAVLLDRARETLARVAPGASSRHEAWDFGYDDHAYESFVALRKGSDHWRTLRDFRPSPVVFWYRTSPEAIVPPELTGRVFLDTPLADLPGMSLLVLDTEGRLARLRTVPGADDAKNSATRVHWPTLLELAGFDPDSVQEATPRDIPATYADERRAWVGRWPGASGRQARIEASALAGRPVEFRVRALESAEAESGIVEAAKTTVGRAAFLELSLYILAILVSAWLAWKNFRLGRVDRRGAARLAGLLSGLVFLGWLFGGPHAASLSKEWNVMMTAVAASLRTGATAWLLYVALEPFVRRRIPQSIITWNRVLAGRFLDPLVGRDLLLGVLAGEFFMLLPLLDKALPEWLGMPPVMHPVTPPLMSLGHIGARLASATAILAYGIVHSMAFLAVLLLFVLLFRRSLWAAIAFIALYALMFSLKGGSPFSLSIVVSVLGVTALTILLTRVGLVAGAVAVGLGWMIQIIPVISDLSSWSAGTTWFVASLVLAPAAFGAWVCARKVRTRVA